MVTQWRVVGGSGVGGILVRRSEDLKSDAEDERLATGSIICQLQLQGQRLHYELITGSGPKVGWVSTTLKGKELVVPEADDGTCHKFPRMYFGAQVPVQTYESFADNYFKRLRAGEIYGPVELYPEKIKQFADGKLPANVRANATGRQILQPCDPVDADFEKRRQIVGENISKVKAELARYKAPGPWKRMTKAQLEKEALHMLPGDSYGIDVPPNLDALERLGAAWLTKAFHAAGTLPLDNSVKQVVVFKRLPMTTKDAAGGAGAKAFLTVEYEQSDPELHTELFVKMPWDVVGTKETGGDALWRYKISGMGDSEYQECTVYHFLGPLFPFKIPKWYFADICRSNTNYILVTEKILFGGSANYLEGKQNTSFGPYEIFPVAEKYFDFDREPRMRYEMYYAIMRAMARLAAWDHTNMFECIPKETKGFHNFANLPCIGNLEFPLKLPEKKRSMGKRVGVTCVGFLRELVCDKGKHCFPNEIRHEGFLDALERAIIDVTVYKDDLQLYQGLFPDKTSLTHQNLQSDNAYFWRNANDEVDCGIIDWGGAQPLPFFYHLMGSLTSCEHDVLFEHELGFLTCYVDEFYRESGVQIDLGEVYRMFLIGMLQSCGGYCINIENEIFREVPREEWSTIYAIEDPRVIGNWNTRCYTYMIRIMLRYLHLHWVRKGSNGNLAHHNALLEWVDYWKAKGME